MRRFLTQCEHERYNATHYPGTRQLCFICDEPTGLCEEDSVYDNDGNPICEECFEEPSD